MRHPLRSLLINILVLLIVAYIAPGLNYHQSLATLVYASVALGIFNTFLRPILKILLLPINLITLGLLGWFVNVIILYLVTLAVPGFSIEGFDLSLFGSSFVLSPFLAYIVVSFLINLVGNLLNWILVLK